MTWGMDSAPHGSTLWVGAGPEGRIVAAWIIDNIYLVGAVSLGAVIGVKVLLWRWFARMTHAPEAGRRGSPDR